MNLLEQHEISEAHHRILNPFTTEKLLLLGEVCRLAAGDRQLDLASGKGELLCQWAARFGIGGVGVDISDVFVPLARARADELGVADRVRFVQADASAYHPGSGLFDVGSCIGATWIADGPAGTVALLSEAVRPGGLVLVGEPFWREDPPAGARSGEHFTSLAGTVDLLSSSGAELVEMVLADEDSWDRYAAGQWWAVREWLDEHPDHPDADEMRDFLTTHRRRYLTDERRCLGWGVFVLRLPG